MNEFYVYLTGKSQGNGNGHNRFSPTAAERSRLERQYRGYLPHHAWLPAPPVFVSLCGRNGKALRKPSDENLYELPLLAPERNGVKKIMAAAAAAASIFLPMSAQPAAAETQPSLPPSAGAVGDRTSVARDAGPPTVTLTTAPRPTTNLLPLLDSKGRPVELGAFHSNVGTPHANTTTPHTNNWTNHSNTFTQHANGWNNHANVPQFTVPHTNITPGNDFIF